jgi:hypothetical protein
MLAVDESAEALPLPSIAWTFAWYVVPGLTGIFM